MQFLKDVVQTVGGDYPEMSFIIVSRTRGLRDNDMSN